MVLNRCQEQRKEKGRNTSKLKHNEEETPWERRCPQALLARTPLSPAGAEAERGGGSTARQKVAFQGEVDYD